MGFCAWLGRLRRTRLQAYLPGPGTDHSPICNVVARQRVRVVGRVCALEYTAASQAPAFTAILDDGSGSIRLVFLGRSAIGGINPGSSLQAQGRAVTTERGLTIFNPEYRILKVRDAN